MWPFYSSFKKLFSPYRIFDCSDRVVSIFAGSDVFEIQALSATLLAKLLTSDPRLQTDQDDQMLDGISAALSRLPQVISVQNYVTVGVKSSPTWHFFVCYCEMISVVIFTGEKYCSTCFSLQDRCYFFAFFKRAQVSAKRARSVHGTF